MISDVIDVQLRYIQASQSRRWLHVERYLQKQMDTRVLLWIYVYFCYYWILTSYVWISFKCQNKFILQYVNSLCDITAFDLNAVRACSRMTGRLSSVSCNDRARQSKFAPSHCGCTTLHCWPLAIAREMLQQPLVLFACLAGCAAAVSTSQGDPALQLWWYKTMNYRAQNDSFQKC